MVRVGQFIACYFLVGIASAHSQQSLQLFAPPPRTVDNPCVVSLNILSYNVHLLPAVALKIAGHRGNSDYRAEQIGKVLAAYDTVGLCEVFDRKHSQMLYEAAQVATKDTFVITPGPQRVGAHLIGSGLAILSRYPVEESHTISYTEASRFLDSGFKADGFAAKGAVHARLCIRREPAMFVDCFLTHLESRSAQARDVQIAEFADFVTKHAGDYPVIVMGDFNIDANSLDNSPEKSQLESLRKQFIHQDRQLIDVWQVVGQGPGNTYESTTMGGSRRLDYIFISDPESVATQLIPLEVKVLPFLDDKVEGGSLSDHSAVSCKAELIVPTASPR
jgi:endonuclease/exonuclease/phosphatase family metal-dependent hydrolase